jgi:hypothetical protein
VPWLETRSKESEIDIIRGAVCHVLDITCDGKLAECLFLLTLGTSRLEAFVAVAVAVSVSVCRRKDV